MIRIERRLVQPKWLSVAVPVGSILAAFVLMAIVLLFTHHPPLHTFERLLRAAFGSEQALNDSLVSATPLIRKIRKPTACGTTYQTAWPWLSTMCTSESEPAVITTPSTLSASETS